MNHDAVALDAVGEAVVQDVEVALPVRKIMLDTGSPGAIQAVELDLSRRGRTLEWRNEHVRIGSVDAVAAKAFARKQEAAKRLSCMCSVVCVATPWAINKEDLAGNHVGNDAVQQRVLLMVVRPEDIWPVKAAAVVRSVIAERRAQYLKVGAVNPCRWTQVRPADEASAKVDLPQVVTSSVPI